MEDWRRHKGREPVVASFEGDGGVEVFELLDGKGDWEEDGEIADGGDFAVGDVEGWGGAPVKEGLVVYWRREGRGDCED